MDENRSFLNTIERFLKNLSEKSSFKIFFSVLMSILFGLLSGLIILLISNPSTALRAFGGILAGSFGDPKSIWVGLGDLLYYATPILLTGLSVGFVFKTGLFNIGAAGQFMVGQFTALIVGFYCGGLGPFQWVAALLAGFIAGAFWGFIPGFFKALFNVNEVITSIMFNYIGMYITKVLVISNGKIYNQARHETFNIPRQAFIPKWGLDKIFPESRVDIGFFIAVLVAVLIYIILNKTKFGFELKGVGYNRHASRYAGINEKKSIILSMAIAGGLAGFGGALKMMAPGSHYIGNTLAAEEVLAGEGFNGIPVALLGLSNPIGIIFAALFITYIQRGGFYIQSIVMIEIIDIIIAIIIYSSAFALAVRTFISKYQQKKRADAELKEEKSEESDIIPLHKDEEA